MFNISLATCHATLLKSIYVHKLWQHVARSRRKFNFVHYIATTCNTFGNMHNAFQLAMRHCMKRYKENVVCITWLLDIHELLIKAKMRRHF